MTSTSAHPESQPAGTPPAVLLHYAYTSPDAEDTGSPVVLLHALGADHSIWDRVRKELGQQRPVYALDLRGHGLSPTTSGAYSLELLARDVEHTLDIIGLGPAHVVGISIGGGVAQELVRLFPARVLSLGLICTATHFGTPEAWAERIETVRRSGTAALAHPVVERWFTPDYAAKRPEDPEFCRELVHTTEDSGYIGCAAALQSFQGTAAARRIAVPSLVVSAEEDTSTPPALVQELADAIPGAQYHSVPHAAHLLAMSHPRLLLELIGQLLLRADAAAQ